MIVALGGLGLAVLVAWQVVVVAAAAYALVLARRETDSRAAALLAAGMLAAGLVLYPLQLGRAAKGARDGHRIGDYAAERYGAAGRGFSVKGVDRAKALIPAGATYYLDVEPRFGGPAFGFWARGWLLPRIAVSKPGDADWILAFYRDPDVLGVPVRDARGLAPGIKVAEVSR
jgi:hypothetical protein